jgi:hypothetical protein
MNFKNYLQDVLNLNSKYESFKLNETNHTLLSFLIMQNLKYIIIPNHEIIILFSGYEKETAWILRHFDICKTLDPTLPNWKILKTIVNRNIIDLLLPPLIDHIIVVKK